MEFICRFGSLVSILISLNATAFAGDRVLVQDNRYAFAAAMRPFGLERAVFCSGALLQHGLYVTAKHCLYPAQERSGPMFSRSAFSIVIPENGLISKLGLVIEPSQILEIIPDAGQNDIAWMVYDPNLTRGKVEIPNISIARDLPSTSVKFEMVGFPSLDRRDDPSLASRKKIRKMIDDEQREFARIKESMPHDSWVSLQNFFDRIEARDFEVLNLSMLDQQFLGRCFPTGKVGVWPRRAKHPGYLGILVETDCPAWFGNSGSVFFLRKDDRLEAYGVLSHTLEILSDSESGEIDPRHIMVDQFDTYSDKVAFSPFSSAESYEEAISLLESF